MSETDSETYYDSDSESLEETNIYEPEEISLTKNNIVICEKYDTRFHGNYNEMNSHYLTHIRFKYFNYDEIYSIIRHDLTRSKIEIAECIYMPSQHCVSIIKTFWIKLIQRKWKNILKERENVIRKRSHIKSLIYRELNGKWPKECSNYPILRGMLSDLSRTSSRTSLRT